MRLLPRSVLAIALGAALTVATLPLASAAPEGVKTVGPSFSCKAPGLTPVERTICDDPSLAKLDLKLWYATMEALDGSYAALELNGNEATWLHHVRDACTTTSCLTDAYHARIAFMQRTDTDTAARAKRESAHQAANDRDTADQLAMPAPLRAKLSALAGTRCLRFVRHIDLGDGRPALLAFECHPPMLSTLTYLFHPGDGSYRVVFSGATGYLRGLELQDERAHGLRRLRIQNHSSCCEHPVSYLDFDGTHYRAVACADEVFRDEKHMEFTFNAC